jgi:hypothetical protein
MLLNIVTSRRLMKYECRLVKEPKEQQSSIPAFLSRSSSECTLNQAIARHIIKCEGDLAGQSQTFIMNAYDCFGETTLMHAAVINDLDLAK